MAIISTSPAAVFFTVPDMPNFFAIFCAEALKKTKAE
jgi:hypothetical protein